MPLSPRLLRPLATGFNPKSISGLALWLDATDRSTLLNSIEPNVTATDGQTVRRWLDKSGNARHAEQSTGANQPTIQADGLVFDGTNDVLAITSGGPITNNVPFLGAFAVYTWASSPTTQKAVVSFSTTNSGNARFHLLGGTVANKGRVGGRRLNADTIANLDTTGDLPTARFIHSGIARYATAEAEVRVNGAVGGSSSSFQTAGNTSADDSAVAWIGAAGAIGASNLANITVRELLIYNATMTASQVTAVERYLARKHGVTLA